MNKNKDNNKFIENLSNETIVASYNKSNENTNRKIYNSLIDYFVDKTNIFDKGPQQFLINNNIFYKKLSLVNNFFYRLSILGHDIEFPRNWSAFSFESKNVDVNNFCYIDAYNDKDNLLSVLNPFETKMHAIIFFYSSNSINLFFLNNKTISEEFIRIFESYKI